MRSGEAFGSRTPRGLELIVGLALAVICLLLAAFTVFALVRSRGRLGAIGVAAASGLVFASLSPIAVRLLRGQRALDERLISPFAVRAGAVILFAGGLLCLFMAVVKGRVQFAAAAIINLSVAYYAWRYISQRGSSRDA